MEFLNPSCSGHHLCLDHTPIVRICRCWQISHLQLCQPISGSYHLPLKAQHYRDFKQRMIFIPSSNHSQSSPSARACWSSSAFATKHHSHHISDLWQYSYTSEDSLSKLTNSQPGHNLLHSSKHRFFSDAEKTIARTQVQYLSFFSKRTRFCQQNWLTNVETPAGCDYISTPKFANKILNCLQWQKENT